jgi:nucleoside-diphosphate-sugar epimerase
MYTTWTSPKHDFDDPAASNKAERAAVETIGTALAGSARRFLLASGTAGLTPGREATEQDRSPFSGPDAPPGGSETLALDYVDRDVHTVSLRFAPTVHGEADHGFIAALVGIARGRGGAGIARARGGAGNVGDGTNRWSAVHRLDAARLVRLGLEKAPARALLHAVGENGVYARDIAEAIGRGLDLPAVSVPADDVAAHIGWIGAFFAMDIPASSSLTQRLLGWSPTGPTLLDDLNGGSYFPS